MSEAAEAPIPIDQAPPDRPHVMTNFPLTLDGKTTIGGVSGPIGTKRDTEMLAGLRTRAEATDFVETSSYEDVMEMSRRLAELSDVTEIELDAGGVSFIDSAGLRALLVASKAASDRGAELRIVVLSDQMARVVEMAGVTDLLPGVPTARVTDAATDRYAPGAGVRG